MSRPAAIATLLALLLTSCSAKTPEVGDTPEPTLTGALSPSPSKTKKRQPVASSVTYVSGGGLFVYDVKTDVAREIVRGEGIRVPRWVNRDEISFLQGDGEGDVLQIVNIKSRQVRQVFSMETGIRTYGWSPDRETLGYVSVDGRGTPHVSFRFMVGDQPTLAVAALAQALGREGSPDDQMRVEFDRTGKRVLVVFTPADGDGQEQVAPDQSQLQVRSIDGDLLHAAAMDVEPTMGVWAPNGRTVWYRTSGGPRQWTVKTRALAALRGGGRWFNPWPSRDSRMLAYDTGATSARVRVRLLDVRTGEVQNVGPAGRSNPVIANARTVWVQDVRRCRDCMTPVVPASRVYAVDLKTGEETRLALRSLVDADVLYR